MNLGKTYFEVMHTTAHQSQIFTSGREINHFEVMYPTRHFQKAWFLHLEITNFRQIYELPEL
jgi:hypothetical protein